MINISYALDMHDVKHFTDTPGVRQIAVFFCILSPIPLRWSGYAERCAEHLLDHNTYVDSPSFRLHNAMVRSLCAFDPLLA